MANSKEYKLAIQIAGMMDSSFGNTCNLTKKQLKDIAKEAAAANADQVSFNQAMEKAGPGIDAAWNGAKSAVMTTAKAMTAAAAAAVAVGAASVNVGQEFETAMDSWSATADATNEQFARAREAAMEMGRTTSKTATESANALEYMALAGWTVEEQIEGLPGILRLSEATALDLATTSDLVTDSMSALGVEVEGLEGYLDIAAKANNASNQTAQQLMEAYIGVGGTLNNLNIPLEESAAALGVLANRGIKGSEAGNALSAVLINLTSGTGQAGKKMEELGISAFDAEGKFIGLQETLGLINTRIADMTEEEQNAALAAIGGKNHIDALNDLMAGLNTTVAEGRTEWEDLEDKLSNAGGALEKMAQTKLDNLQGDVAILNSALEDAGIQIYDHLQEPLRNLTQSGTQLVYDFAGSLAEGLEKTIPTIKRNMIEAKEAVSGFAEPLLGVGRWMIENPDVIAGGLAAIGTTITALKVAKTITDTAQAMNALKVAMMSNPVTAAVGIAAMAGGAIVGIAAKVKTAEAQLKRQNLAEHFGDINLSLSELKETAGQIIDNGQLDNLNMAIDELEKVKDLAESLKNSQKTLDKLNWKVSMGFQLSETDMDEYGRRIEDYIQNSVSLGEQQQYAMNLNLQVLTDDDETGREIISQFNSFYDGLNAELKEYGEQLGEAYAEGMKDGVLSMEEIETIQELQGKMADITAKLSSSQFEAKMETIGIKYGGGELDAETYKNLQAEIQEQVEAASENLEESLTMNIAGAKLQLEEGAIDTEQYEAMVEEFKSNYLEQVGEIQLKAASFQTETLYKQYDTELSQALPGLKEHIDEAMANYLKAEGDADLSFDAFTSVMYNFSAEIPQDAKNAMGELWEAMEPELKQLEELKEEYMAAGKEIPETLVNAISDMSAIGAIVGSQDAMWSYIGANTLSNGEYQKTVNAMRDAGYVLPESVAEGLSGNVAVIENEIDGVHSRVERYIKDKFGIFSVASRINMDLQVTMDGDGEKKSKRYSPKDRLIPHAEGGIFDTPHYGVFAEAGPEAFIPIDRSERSMSIWEQTGRELGILGGWNSDVSNISNSDNSERNINYSPIFNIYGTGEDTVRNTVDDDYERFVRFMDLYNKTNRRLAF